MASHLMSCSLSLIHIYCGTYNMMIGAADMGTGCDTILAQMAAEVLDCEPDDITAVSYTHLDVYKRQGIQVVHTWLGCVVAATIIALPLMYRNARAAFEPVSYTHLPEHIQTIYCHSFLYPEILCKRAMR